MSIDQLILKVLNEIEKKETNVNIAGGRGYGAGKVYSNNSVSVSSLLGDEEDEESKEYNTTPVKISKIFKRGKNDK